MYDLENIGKRVKELRKKKGYTQEKAAEELEMNLRTYRAVETGSRAGRIDTLCMIADYYGVSVDYLLDRESGVEEMIALDYQGLTPEKRKLWLRLMNAVLKELKMDA